MAARPGGSKLSGQARGDHKTLGVGDIGPRCQTRGATYPRSFDHYGHEPDDGACGTTPVRTAHIAANCRNPRARA